MRLSTPAVSVPYGKKQMGFGICLLSGYFLWNRLHSLRAVFVEVRFLMYLLIFTSGMGLFFSFALTVFACLDRREPKVMALGNDR